MAKLKLKNKDLKGIGYTNNTHIGLALNIAKQYCKWETKDHVLQLLKNIMQEPKAYLDNTIWSTLANKIHGVEKQALKEIPIYDEARPYKTYGTKYIDSNAKNQMDIAMRLPITVGGALMPDAHHGYGLPIGGVVALDNAVMPYGVGMDIGCRMCLTIYDLPTSYLKEHRYELKLTLKEHTYFGKEENIRPKEDPIFERSEFKEIAFVKRLKDKAYKQLGSSGSGNHFVEFGVAEITEPNNEMGLAPKSYFAILSHSGSRGFGATIAQNYTKIAMSNCFLPQAAKNLAWLSLDTEAGMEYWLAMNLAGDYASACHHHIHKNLSKVIGLEPIATVENHHNFAWKERMPDGKEVIVHRKGATPAGKGVLGVIPGSMTAAGYIVRGKGNTFALNSASHGAGRAMSRYKAKNSITSKEFRKMVKSEGVELIGGGVDEAPIAYKDIERVMLAQEALVEVLGKFHPKIVRMDK